MTKLIFDHQAIRAYKRLSYTPWHAMAEFVDNSTQAFMNNEEELAPALAAEDSVLRVAIDYHRDDDVIRITDNSVGMDEETLDLAMVVGVPPANSSGRSRYGMGMKTAACWFGDFWTVRTSRYGSPVEYFATVDVDAVASGTIDLPIEMSTVARDSHYTIIEISKLNRSFYGRTLGKIRQHLSSMYRDDLRSGRLELRWMGEALRWEESDARFLTDEEGRPHKHVFEFEIDEKRVAGWAGVLAKGSRSDAGFSILHNGRVIRGWPEPWRPQEIFGQVEGSNDLVNQRLVGEVHLDDFDVTHTKDDILWVEGEEDAVERRLRREVEPLMEIARTSRLRPKRGPGKGPIRKVAAELQALVTAPSSSSQEDDEEILVAVPDVVRRIVDRYRASPPDISGVVRDTRLLAYLTDEEAPTAPYVSISRSEEDELRVIANLRHPFLREVSSSEALGTYLRTVLVALLALREMSDGDLAHLIADQDSLMRAWSPDTA